MFKSGKHENSDGLFCSRLCLSTRSDVVSDRNVFEVFDWMSNCGKNESGCNTRWEAVLVDRSVPTRQRRRKGDALIGV